MNSIDNILKISMEHIRNLVDANTVIGTPIALPDGSYVIPVTKVGMGLLSGGCDIPTANPIKKSAEAVCSEYPFGGTAAVGMGLSPVAFITVKDGDIKFTPVEYKSAVDRLIDTAIPILNSIAEKLIPNCEN